MSTNKQMSMKNLNQEEDDKTSQTVSVAIKNDEIYERSVYNSKYSTRVNYYKNFME